MANGRRAEMWRDRILGWYRSPLRVAAVVFIAWLLVWDTGRTAFSTDEGKNAWLDWIVLASIVYGAALQLILIPRYFAPTARRRSRSPEGAALRVASMRLALAATPFLVGFGLHGAGADLWAATVALLASTLMLIPYIREARASFQTR